MTRYEDPAFKSKYCSKEFKDGWERTFGKSEQEQTLDELTQLGQDMGEYAPVMKDMDAPGLGADVTRHVIEAEMPLDVTMEVWVVVETHEVDVYGEDFAYSYEGFKGLPKAFVSKAAAELYAGSDSYLAVIPTKLLVGGEL